MRRLIPPALLALTAASALADLPPSLDRARIEACAPTTIEAATECLRSALSAEDASILVGSPTGGGYRGYLDGYLRAAWRLADAEAPLARNMRERAVYDPRGAPGLIIANLRASMRGATRDWRAVAAAHRQPPVERAAVRTTTQEAPHGD